ncbi:hypothetical protein [Amycolatopsis sp. NBC_00438]|uniref:hypothetical protein n=1 Tax=Amycolatopsis sp. NBC_00438 TaxID=2903558 RepID=UPI002E227A67
MPRASLLISSAFLLAMATACASPVANQPAPVVASTTSAVTTVAQPSATSAPSPAQSAPASIAPVATAPSKPKPAPKPKSTPKAHSKAACLKDENQCYEPGTNVKCQTGGCVDAARGLTQRDVESARQKWLRENPGWCPVGTQGAVAPC